ncbi:MAG: hypothetical protein ABF291_10350 [Desulfobacterales bacterium]
MIRKSCIFLKLKLCFFIVAITAMMLSLSVSSVSAEENPTENSSWEFRVAPYMWFISLVGDVTVRGQESDLDLNFSDIWDELNIAGMLTFDARKGKWGIFGDTIGANLGKKKTVGGIRIHPTVKLALLTAGGSYQLGKWKLSSAAGKEVPVVTLDGMFGVRYTYLDIDLDFKRIRDASGHKDWFDPLIGARAFFDLSDHWALSLQGNVGGFGVGSDFTWGAMCTIGYRFRLFSEENNARLVGGYRAIYQDYSEGSESNRFEWEVTLHGPILGLVISF